ncbi:MAG TPA: hypothetical protein VIG73_05065 [Cerasibacillus sp.]|uniref:hypothetical protein n=1 Tax=Cerasibacillus sp. TaxID=2498711 RepID=UPI002F3FC6E9
MEIRLGERVEQLTEKLTTDDVIATINALLGEDFYFEGLKIDGEVVQDDVEQVLHDRLSSIQTIEVLAVEAQDFVIGLLASGEEYAKRASKHAPQLVEALKSENVNAEDWANVNDILGGVQWILSMTEVIDQSIIEVNDWEDLVQVKEQFEAQLPTLQTAMEKEESVAIATTIEKFVIPYFATVQRVTKEAFDEQFTRPTIQ